MSYCGMCGTPCSEGDRFCGSCGAVLSAFDVARGPVPPAPVAMSPSFGPSPPGPSPPGPPPAGRLRPGPPGQQAWFPPPAPNAAPPRPPFDVRAMSGAVNHLVGEFQQLPLRTLVPLRAWVDQKIWQQTWVALFLIAALAPFLLLHLGSGSENFHQVAWGFSVYFAFLWFIALYTLIRPGPLPWALLGKVALFTVIAGVSIAVGLEKRLATGDSNVAKCIFGVGLPEEFAKALAIYMFMFLSRTTFSLRSFLFVGAVSGLAFGAAEAVSYSTAYAQQLPYVVNPNDAIVTEIWRFLTDSLFHACMAGVTAFFIGLAHHYRQYRVGLIGFGLAFAAVLHGLYDNFASGWLGTALAVLIVFIFVGYVATGDQIGERLGEHLVQADGPRPSPEQAPPADPSPPGGSLPGATRQPPA